VDKFFKNKKMKYKKILYNKIIPLKFKELSLDQLPQLCDEVRNFVIESVSKTGGHFGSNLGVVELTVALHSVFDTPKDLLIWDVGHQTYPHKILTGRKNRMKTIRQKDGLAPFPKRAESEYDALDVGHSSTSISAAVGMSIANKNKKTQSQVVAIIGDGALTGGMAFEALNHAGDNNADMLVILNDNKMSISANVGAMSKYLTKLTTSTTYNFLRKKKEQLPENIKLRKCAHRVKSHIKGAIRPKVLFEDLGFKYYGPVDGHNVKGMVKILEKLKKIKGPKFLHIITTKGKGCKKAENHPCCLHATKPFKIKEANKCKKQVSNKNISYTNVFADWVNVAGTKYSKLQTITPAMCEGSGLVDFREKFPERYHDVGIAEQHALTFAAGLACQGVKPVVAIYSSFLQRAYDQLIHDIALQNLDVLLAIDRAGIVGPDGATHAGSFDISFMRIIPNLIIMAPANVSECYAMLETGYKYKGPVAVRYPRGGGIEEYNDKLKKEIIEIGKGKIITEGKKIAILVFGAALDLVRNLKIDATLVNMRFVKPLDKILLKKLALTHEFFVTIEDNVIAGGAGSAVNEFILSEKLKVKVKNIGLPDKFLPHGTREEILDLGGLSSKNIKKEIKEFVN
jgi:1-deoxy-D-xylulose-5-phosphate synthase